MAVVQGDSWDLELRLGLGRTTDVSPAESCTSSSRGTHVINGSFGDSTRNPHLHQQQQQKKKITMFYNGQICVDCDVTALQAKAILSMAMATTEKMDDAMSTNSPSHQQRLAQASSPPAPAPPTSPQATQRLYQPAGLSMKRSLQRFLQKRKSRIGAVAPYAHGKQQLLLFPIESDRSFISRVL